MTPNEVRSNLEARGFTCVKITVENCALPPWSPGCPHIVKVKNCQAYAEVCHPATVMVEGGGTSTRYVHMKMSFHKFS